MLIIIVAPVFYKRSLCPMGFSDTRLQKAVAICFLNKISTELKFVLSTFILVNLKFLNFFVCLVLHATPDSLRLDNWGTWRRC